MAKYCQKGEKRNMDLPLTFSSASISKTGFSSFFVSGFRPRGEAKVGSMDAQTLEVNREAPLHWAFLISQGESSARSKS